MFLNLCSRYLPFNIDARIYALGGSQQFLTPRSRLVGVGVVCMALGPVHVPGRRSESMHVCSTHACTSTLCMCEDIHA